MADLNVMILEQARAGLQTQLDTAVTNGDTEAARKIAADMLKLEGASRPAAPPYGDVEIKAALEAKAPWFGTDPRKSGAALRLGKDMNPKKFATAEAFADALIKAVDEEFKPAGGTAAPNPENEDPENEDPENEDEDDTDKGKPAAGKPRRTDGPGEGEGTGTRQRRSGPWAKLSDAPADVQKEIRRTADKFAPKTEKGRENFITRALEAQYSAHKIRTGKK